MVNNATRSSVSDVFAETMRPREQKRYLVNALKCLTERIICGVPGNHEARSGKDADDDPLFDVFCKLDLEDVYRQNIAFVRLCFGERNKKAVAIVYACRCAWLGRRDLHGRSCQPERTVYECA